MTKDKNKDDVTTPRPHRNSASGTWSMPETDVSTAFKAAIEARSIYTTPMEGYLDSRGAMIDSVYSRYGASSPTIVYGGDKGIGDVFAETSASLSFPGKPAESAGVEDEQAKALALVGESVYAVYSTFKDTGFTDDQAFELAKLVFADTLTKNE